MSCSHNNKTERIKSCPDPANCEKNHPHIKYVCEDCGFVIGELP
jgi:transcription initiation factor TFIIIB Brf1 subunit/transcription initiation factor TFIIB